MTIIVGSASPGAAVHQFTVPVVREVRPAPAPPAPRIW
jgi:hypothetical protein